MVAEAQITYNKIAEPIRWGVIGFGRVFERFHGPALAQQPNAIMEIAFDRHDSRRDWLRSAYPQVKIATSAAEVVAASEVDVILIAPSPAYHLEYVHMVVKSGTPALVEKPFALELAAARETMEAIQAANVPLAVGFNRRFRAPNQQLKAALTQLDRPPEAVEFELRSSLVLWDPVSPDEPGWDVLSDLACHQADLLRWLLEREVTWISGARGSEPDAVESTVTYDLEFEGGVRAHCLVSHSAEYQERLRVLSAGRWYVADADGLYSYPSRAPWLAPLAAAWARVRSRLGRRSNITLDSFIREQQAVIQWVQSGEKPDDLADAVDGVRSVEIVAAIRKSLALAGAREVLAAPGRQDAEAAVSVENAGELRSDTNSAANRPDSPALSIVLILGNQRARGSEALASLLGQEGIESTEIILIDAADDPHAAKIEGGEHPAIRVIRAEEPASFGALRALGASQSRGELVAFMEEHVIALPGWLAAAQAHLRSTWAGVGGEMHTANAGVGISDVIALMNYTAWRPPARSGETTLVPGQNNLYRRAVLERYREELPQLLENESVFNTRMVANDELLYLDADLKFAHRNEATLALVCRGYFHWHRNYGHNRAVAEGKGRIWRLMRAVSWPLVPLVRAARMGRTILKERPHEFPFFLRSLGVILVSQGAAAAGTAIGTLWGPGDSARMFLDHELNAERPMPAGSA